jgi:cell wall assembly regulator SMI1
VDAELRTRIANAVTAGVRARAQFYDAIELPNEQELAPPATEERIARLEQHVGRALPPSYKTFLSLHNGWRMVDAETDLLSIEEMLGGPRADRIREWQQNAAKWGDEVGGHGLVIGFSDISQSRIILDPRGVSADGEWKLYENYKDEEQEYDSFLEWLEQSVDDYQDLAMNPNPDEDEDGDDE